MAFYFFCFCSLVALIAIGAARLKVWESNRDMINVEWLEHSDKFELIARWGARG